MLASDCQCGFYDVATEQLFTEAIIVYFNETDTIPENDLKVEEYENKYERGWNTIYRQGGKASHVRFSVADSPLNRDSTLELTISPPTREHLVVGGHVQTKRRDIQFGLFRSLIRGPQPSMGGSAMSMQLFYNQTESWEMRLSNTNNASIAYLSMLTHSEFPGRDVGLNYTTLSNTSLANFTSTPWDFVELGVVWTKEIVNFTYNGVLGRHVSKKSDSQFPVVAGPVSFRHWSTGDAYAMQGPPLATSGANIAWSRMFFNSSLMNEEGHRDFTRRCNVLAACRTDDFRLRGSSSYPSEALKPWYLSQPVYALRLWALPTIGVCLTIALMLIVNILMQTLQVRPNQRQRRRLDASRQQSTAAFGLDLPQDLPSSYVSTARSSITAVMTMNGEGNSRSTPPDELSRMTDPSDKLAATEKVECKEIQSVFDPMSGLEVKSSLPKKPWTEVTVSEVIHDDRQDQTESGHVAALPTQRVEYMAGLNTICALMVTLQHFTLTFTPAVVMSPSPENIHYKSDLWARATVFPFLLNEIWLGLFFTTSSRFLVEKFLKDGDLVHLASKAVGRVPRLMIPVTAMVILEYFLMDCGVLNWLVYLPSITWSPWPYTTVYTNFWLCVNRVLELMFLIPNDFPQITFNYCTGVLWTIPPTIEGSWTALLGVVIVFEIKRPWKRFFFYAWSMMANWYARNWGGYFWAGLMLADMDITYAYRRKLQSRTWLRVGLVVSFAMIGLLMNGVDLIRIVSGLDILTLENNLHPDIETGLPLARTARAGYPQYYEPRLTGLVNAVAIQVAVELSPMLQRWISNRVFMSIFPHMFTMYLVHGIIWWSLGAWVCIRMAVLGLPYWANLMVTGVSCYAMLFFIALPILTPPLEYLGRSATQMIWANAHEPAIPKRPTLYPFDKSILERDVVGATPFQKNDVRVERWRIRPRLLGEQGRANAETSGFRPHPTGDHAA